MLVLFFPPIGLKFIKGKEMMLLRAKREQWGIFCLELQISIRETVVTFYSNDIFQSWVLKVSVDTDLKVYFQPYCSRNHILGHAVTLSGLSCHNGNLLFIDSDLRKYLFET